MTKKALRRKLKKARDTARVLENLLTHDAFVCRVDAPNGYKVRLKKAGFKCEK